ncbi:MAG: F0F1 ATP synthase subunit epsilon [Actinomycetaceae bacterium]|nr:F0F1 ATP synthase subunit epsilon [Actinomycetaceae bacterium]MDU0970456.1 F0F1 ATP synthase subunit epsilon [Actinomycetaceae bacterium]
MALQVRIVSRESELFSGEADYVSVPSVSGSLGVLPGREPVLAALKPGKVVIRSTDGDTTEFDVSEGFASVDSDVVSVVVDEKLGD